MSDKTKDLVDYSFSSDEENEEPEPTLKPETTTMEDKPTEKPALENKTTTQLYKPIQLDLVLEETLINIQLHSTPIESLAHALELVLPAEEEPETTLNPETTTPESTEEPAIENETTTLKYKSVRLDLVLEETLIEIRGNQIYKSCCVCQQC